MKFHTVKAAAAHLDSRLPDWWTKDRIDPDKIQQDYADNCVIGQVAKSLGLDYEMLMKHFELGDVYSPLYNPVFNSPTFTAAWRKEVRKRQAGAKEAAVETPSDLSPDTKLRVEWLDSRGTHSSTLRGFIENPNWIDKASSISVVADRTDEVKAWVKAQTRETEKARIQAEIAALQEKLAQL